MNQLKLFNFHLVTKLFLSNIFFNNINLDIDRVRRLSQILEFLQIFDTEKDIAEINILYFLYMKYEGNIQKICRDLKCDTIIKVCEQMKRKFCCIENLILFFKLKRCIELIEQGIRHKELPIYQAFTSFEMSTIIDCLHMMDKNTKTEVDEQLTLTDIFHQFDTVTLRGRTSIDRYLNIQQAN